MVSNHKSNCMTPTWVSKLWSFVLAQGLALAPNFESPSPWGGAIFKNGNGSGEWK